MFGPCILLEYNLSRHPAVSDDCCYTSGVTSLDYLYLYDYLNELESLEGLSGLQNVTTGIYISNAKKLKCDLND